MKSTWLIVGLVASVAVTGYFIGLQSPMNPPHQDAEQPNDVATIESASDSIPAARYDEMRQLSQLASSQTQEGWYRLLDVQSDPMASIIINDGDKQQALAARAQLRAYNGAPPTIPHPIEQYSAVACMLCHESGIQTESLRAAKMPHPFYANCTQCHVESNPQLNPSPPLSETSFVGLPAPFSGPRAFQGAPPQIPHTLWFRNDCLSCHGPTGQPGLRTTHPWRLNCQQCHTSPASLNQAMPPIESLFLPSPVINESESDGQSQ